MNPKRSLIIVGALAVIALIAAAGSFVYAQQNASGGNDARSIAGSWIISISPDPASGVPSFVNYSSMTKDGRAFSSNTAGLMSLGEWVKKADGSYALILAGSEGTDEEFMSYEIRATVTVSEDGEKLSGPFITYVWNLDNNLVFTMPGTMRARRMHVKTLD